MRERLPGLCRAAGARRPFAVTLPPAVRARPPRRPGPLHGAEPASGARSRYSSPYWNCPHRPSPAPPRCRNACRARALHGRAAPAPRGSGPDSSSRRRARRGRWAPPAPGLVHDEQLEPDPGGPPGCLPEHGRSSSFPAAHSAKAHSVARTVCVRTDSTGRTKKRGSPAGGVLLAAVQRDSKARQGGGPCADGASASATVTCAPQHRGISSSPSVRGNA